jgi:hypothetical protein
VQIRADVDDDRMQIRREVRRSGRSYREERASGKRGDAGRPESSAVQIQMIQHGVHLRPIRHSAVL